MSVTSHCNSVSNVQEGSSVNSRADHSTSCTHTLKVRAKKKRSMVEAAKREIPPHVRNCTAVPKSRARNPSVLGHTVSSSCGRPGRGGKYGFLTKHRNRQNRCPHWSIHAMRVRIISTNSEKKPPVALDTISSKLERSMIRLMSTWSNRWSISIRFKWWLTSTRSKMAFQLTRFNSCSTLILSIFHNRRVMSEEKMTDRLSERMNPYVPESLFVAVCHPTPIHSPICPYRFALPIRQGQSHSQWRSHRVTPQ